MNWAEYASNIGRSVNVYVSQGVRGDIERRQVRFPKSKRRRIRKKWSKNRKNWRWVESPAYFETPFGIMTNAAGYAALNAWGIRPDDLAPSLYRGPL